MLKDPGLMMSLFLGLKAAGEWIEERKIDELKQYGAIKELF